METVGSSTDPSFGARTAAVFLEVDQGADRRAFGCYEWGRPGCASIGARR